MNASYALVRTGIEGEGELGNLSIVSDLLTFPFVLCHSPSADGGERRGKWKMDGLFFNL